MYFNDFFLYQQGKKFNQLISVHVKAGLFADANFLMICILITFYLNYLMLFSSFIQNTEWAKLHRLLSEVHDCQYSNLTTLSKSFQRRHCGDALLLALCILNASCPSKQTAAELFAAPNHFASKVLQQLRSPSSSSCSRLTDNCHRDSCVPTVITLHFNSRTRNRHR